MLFIQIDEGITLLPANLELSAMEMSLVSTMNRERILKGYLDRVKDNFDFVVIDCMPSLVMININYFPKELQESLADNMAREACSPSHDQTIRMRRLLREEKLTPESIAAFLIER